MWDGSLWLPSQFPRNHTEVLKDVQFLGAVQGKKNTEPIMNAGRVISQKSDGSKPRLGTYLAGLEENI